jgi:hypothetical protein
LRYLLIEATTWLCQIPRYRQTYQRVMSRRGAKVARLVVARLALRSIHKILKDQVRFDPAPRPQPGQDAFSALGPAGGRRQKRKGPDDSGPSRRIGTGPALGSLASVALSSGPAQEL